MLLVGDIVEREAARSPRKVAVVDAVAGRALTYPELRDRIAALARALRDAGLAAGDRVAILALNRIECFEVYLAAARAGLVAQGLNWRLAADELEQILRDSAPRVLVCDAELAGLGDELARRVDLDLCLRFGPGSDGGYEDFLARGAGLPPGDEPARAPQDPALVIYTGGTTGRSKGAVHTNRSLLAAMVNNTVAERVVPSDRYLLLGQAFHSASVLALNYLMHGARVVLVPRFDPRLALEVIESERVTASLVFPAMINYMLSEAAASGFDLGSLRNVQYGGGPVAPGVVRAMLDALPCTLIQCYGSTEHIGVTFLSQEDHAEAAAGRDAHRLASCGRAAHLTRVRVVDERGRPVPPDRETVGEIVVDSPSNMAGYWRQPDLTREVTDPVNGLRTGDLATWDADGYLYVVGRAKEMIVSGGENVYPAQVENAIAEHPGVLEVAVVGARDEVWGETVAAFVVRRPGADPGAADIQRIVAERLGSYQKPRVVHFMAELPKAPTGKVAKHELRERVAEPSPAAGDPSTGGSR